MAQKTMTVLIDDLTGKQLRDGAGETVRFALDGIGYEIDLDANAAQQLRSTIEPYVSAGRRMTNAGKPMRHTKTSADTSAVRAWAASNGIQLSARGRIPGSVVQQYHDAGN